MLQANERESGDSEGVLSVVAAEQDAAGVTHPPPHPNTPTGL
jgi:hypothetical protein